jgi:ferrochelatase
MSKTAVVLFNLGGPESSKAIFPFLFSLFNDRSIINLPQPLRALVAFAITLKRWPSAYGIYRKIGGRSPLLEQTQKQAEALEKKLNKKPGEEFKTFFCMRHRHPKSGLIAKKVKAYGPDRVLLLPLYPQYSTTSTGSSFTDWDAASRKAELDVTTSRICCYPADFGFITAHAKLIKDMYWKASEEGKPRLLFSAHGLPEKIVMDGDPYQSHVEKTVEAIVQVLAMRDLDYSTCYQSRVGRLEWIGPATEDEIMQAGEDKVPLLVVPVSFVSEHSETLVELDIAYRKLAQAHGVPGYWRVPTLSVEPLFIESLADLCLKHDWQQSVSSCTGQRVCNEKCGKCPCAIAAETGAAETVQPEEPNEHESLSVA